MKNVLATQIGKKVSMLVRLTVGMGDLDINFAPQVIYLMIDIANVPQDKLLVFVSENLNHGKGVRFKPIVGS